MIPELGKYAVPVLASYGVSLALLLVLVGLTWLRGRRMREALREVEERGAAARARKKAVADG